MNCERCNGLMSHEKFYSEFGEEFWGWRCVNCGELIDDVVLRNRQRNKK